MTQTQIVQTLADKCEVTKTLAQTAVTEVKKNDMFVLPGIGRLVRVERKARMGRRTLPRPRVRLSRSPRRRW
jgi:DNA-binding protein HU-beta